MFSKNKNRQQYSGSVSAEFRRGNATTSRSQRRERFERQQATERQLGIARRLRKHRHRIQLGLIILLVAALLIGWRSTLSKTTVSSEVKLDSTHKERYQNYISGRVGEYSVLQQGWSLNSPSLAEDVVKKFPEIKEVSFTNRPLTTTLSATLSFRTPLFVWRDSSGQDRFIDGAGVLFTDNVTQTDTKKLTVIEDESGLVIDSGNTALSEATTKLIGDAPQALKALYPKGIQAVVIPQSTREIRIKLKDTRYYIKFSTERSLAEQVGELKTLKHFLDSKKITPSSYVDVRLEHKAFFK